MIKIRNLNFKYGEYLFEYKINKLRKLKIIRQFLQSLLFIIPNFFLLRKNKALINVSNLPRSNFLAIDEGWGTMDSDNLNSVYSLFQYLKSQFQFALIVSHIDSMRDAVDTLLEIKKENNFSNIKFD